MNFRHISSLFIVLTLQFICLEFARASSEIQKNEWISAPLGDKRILVICLPGDIAIKSEQIDALYASIDWAGYDERHITIVEIRQSKLHDSRIRDIAQCSNKLEYVLIGKDQTTKKRWDAFPLNDDLYATIDAMPMRRFEMIRQLRAR